MRKLILTAMIAGLLVPAGLHAQRVYKDVDNRVILDLTEEAGMPAGAITTTGKEWSGSPNVNGGPMADNTENGSINAEVYHKLEIAPHDMNNVGGIGTSDTNFSMNWVTAFNGCIGSTYDYGGWRLPTQRELQLMYIFQPALNDVIGSNGTAFSQTLFWSATERSAPYSWIVDFSSGNTAYYFKTNWCRVRCVREL